MYFKGPPSNLTVLLKKIHFLQAKCNIYFVYDLQGRIQGGAKQACTPTPNFCGHMPPRIELMHP